VLILYRIQKILPFPKKVIEPVFILGTGRSGTTILGVTLGMHRDVGFLNEPKALWAYAFENEDLIGSYNQNQASYILDETSATTEVKQRLHKVFGHYLRFTFSSKVVDKYPELIFRFPFVRAVFPDAKFIFLFRDGYDTCNSIENWSRRLGVAQGGENHDWWGRNNRKWNLLCDQLVSKDDALAIHLSKIKDYKDHTAMAAVEWIVTMKKGLELVNKYPGIVLPVKYEDYVNEGRVREEVLKFCGLKKDDNFAIYCGKVLSAAPSKPKFELPAEITSEFSRVMSRLGYER